MASRLYETFEPSAVIGFGGYPALPALMAAQRDRIPTLIHEQNAVLGRVNRLVAGRVDAIATAYPDVERLAKSREGKTHLVGNPVRDEVLALRDQPYPALTDEGVFRLLVTGGSQGATILVRGRARRRSACCPSISAAGSRSPSNAAPRISRRVRARYAALGIPADLATYIPDMPDKLAWSHLVIARAGASTIAELTAAGRPAILIPLPSATDDHQTANAREMAKAGGARMIAQQQFHAGRARQADAEARARARRARQCGGARQGGRPARRGERSRRSRRAHRPRPRRRSAARRGNGPRPDPRAFA